jgi:hypothetical protein
MSNPKPQSTATRRPSRTQILNVETIAASQVTRSALGISLTRASKGARRGGVGGKRKERGKYYLGDEREATVPACNPRRWPPRKTTRAPGGGSGDGCGFGETGAALVRRLERASAGDPSKVLKSKVRVCLDPELNQNFKIIFFN